ncbi:hypothetical protein DBV15_05703 [Temnothorax longispinosus]|uniref:Uncharacterized protein n=1 Tax=Temnothorax longispinosus TaxID=300112 RepID=A0A4S2J9K3_9HYME|nr:hypothetical protein DBV15_05703 [Temnothorax longispinosus]
MSISSVVAPTMSAGRPGAGRRTATNAASAIRNTRRLPAGIRNEPRVTRSNEYQMHTSSANAERLTRMRARTLDVRFHPIPENWPTRLELSPIPLSREGPTCHLGEDRGKGNAGEDASRVSSSCSLIPRESLVSPTSTKTRGCRPSSSPMLPATRRRLRREMGFFNLRFAFSSSLSLVRMYFIAYHCKVTPADAINSTLKYCARCRCLAVSITPRQRTVRHNNMVASRFPPEPLTIPRIPNSECTTFFYGHQRPGVHGLTRVAALFAELFPSRRDHFAPPSVNHKRRGILRKRRRFRGRFRDGHHPPSSRLGCNENIGCSVFVFSSRNVALLALIHRSPVKLDAATDPFENKEKEEDQNCCVRVRCVLASDHGERNAASHRLYAPKALLNRPAELHRVLPTSVRYGVDLVYFWPDYYLEYPERRASGGWGGGISAWGIGLPGPTPTPTPKERTRNIPIHYNYQIIPMLARIEGKEPEIRDSHYRNLTSYYIDTAALRESRMGALRENVPHEIRAQVNNYVIENQSLHAAHVILRFPAPVCDAQIDHRFFSFNPILKSEEIPDSVSRVSPSRDTRGKRQRHEQRAFVILIVRTGGIKTTNCNGANFGRDINARNHRRRTNATGVARRNSSTEKRFINDTRQREDERVNQGPSSTRLAVLPSEWLVSAKIGFLRIIRPFSSSGVIGITQTHGKHSIQITGIQAGGNGLNSDDNVAYHRSYFLPASTPRAPPPISRNHLPRLTFSDFGQSRESTRWTDVRAARAILATIHAGVIGDRKASRALTGTAEMLQASLHLRPRTYNSIRSRGNWDVQCLPFANGLPTIARSENAARTQPTSRNNSIVPRFYESLLKPVITAARIPARARARTWARDELRDATSLLAVHYPRPGFFRCKRKMTRPTSSHNIGQAAIRSLGVNVAYILFGIRSLRMRHVYDKSNFRRSTHLVHERDFDRPAPSLLRSLEARELSAAKALDDTTVHVPLSESNSHWNLAFTDDETAASRRIGPASNTVKIRHNRTSRGLPRDEGGRRRVKPAENDAARGTGTRSLCTDHLVTRRRVSILGLYVNSRFRRTIGVLRAPPGSATVRRRTRGLLRPRGLSYQIDAPTKRSRPGLLPASAALAPRSRSGPNRIALNASEREGRDAQTGSDWPAPGTSLRAATLAYKLPDNVDGSSKGWAIAGICPVRSACITIAGRYTRISPRDRNRDRNEISTYGRNFDLLPFDPRADHANTPNVTRPSFWSTTRFQPRAVSEGRFLISYLSNERMNGIPLAVSPARGTSGMRTRGSRNSKDEITLRGIPESVIRTRQLDGNGNVVSLWYPTCCGTRGARLGYSIYSICIHIVPAREFKPTTPGACHPGLLAAGRTAANPKAKGDPRGVAHAPAKPFSLPRGLTYTNHQKLETLFAEGPCEANVNQRETLPQELLADLIVYKLLLCRECRVLIVIDTDECAYQVQDRAHVHRKEIVDGNVYSLSPWVFIIVTRSRKLFHVSAILAGSYRIICAKRYFANTNSLSLRATSAFADAINRPHNRSWSADCHFFGDTPRDPMKKPTEES